MARFSIEKESTAAHDPADTWYEVSAEYADDLESVMDAITEWLRRGGRSNEHSSTANTLIDDARGFIDDSRDTGDEVIVSVRAPELNVMAWAVAAQLEVTDPATVESASKIVGLDPAILEAAGADPIDFDSTTAIGNAAILLLASKQLGGLGFPQEEAVPNPS